ncbi:efflux RND transporter periplasmic adaptor subunit [Candidatus Nitronereus thalassa]|uniref:Efflux RND transporter periplasmic adaptor subunit n=1 Tax=Candidatus Nitronereus thalassa TaxID=3020898 RepID=A0ABU3K975_9BACT|nr:efflux RND transporter periplasmic adaptor subunit [Candidatus Nitronereus thalassa]MDT7042956.1 efflux RND transporter periplasmic adaptor subunit [Candidatus Nitronereus thalassa]
MLSLVGCFSEESTDAGQEGKPTPLPESQTLAGPDQETILETAHSDIVSPAVKVLVQPVILTSNDHVFEGMGTGRARLSVKIFPAVAEEVTTVLFEAQDRVSKGDVLVLLDDREEKLAVRLAEIELKNARSLLGRYEQAVKEGAVPESEVDTARADFEAAQVALDQAWLDLEKRRIKAPFDGVVGLPKIDPGDRVDTNTPITDLDDREILHVDFEVPEALAGALRKAQADQQNITATTPAYLDHTFSGHISALESRVNETRRTVLARVNLQNKADLLRPGMSFTTRWEIPGGQYPTVPEISLQWGREGSFVWIVRDNKAEKIPVQVIARKSGSVLVKGELAKGEPVVVEGLQRLRLGINVEVLGASDS